ncbi:hypothetical protein F8C76_15650 [Flagellimonas olearia]|uniref:Bacteriophage abortive infection AbiH n=1 Tax=Flagellimonas olearia TaxID=552546 RepID=A0A6I1DYW8_9FLAO|nr:AbiH family protein [Allomuricauda olearia]KAB7529264.1 hypothetical protein F8C76_15650 [Allomuricauda olearia]
MENKSYTYNRIVIIGNGFDLALGYKTSYSDFLLHYLKSRLNHVTFKAYSDRLFSSSDLGFMDGDDFNSCRTVQDLVNFFEDNKQLNVKFNGILKDVFEFQKIENWVDIETLYFGALLPKFDLLKKQNPNKRDYNSIKAYNDTFRDLTKYLNDYIFNENLNQLKGGTPHQFYEFLSDCVIKQPNRRVCLNHEITYDELDNPSNVLFLNFNYTDSLHKVLGFSGLKPEYQIINIHGQAGSNSSPIIFGYGDDTHRRYTEMEGENSDALLEFIKSFYYNRTTDYHKMLGFMEMDKYEVYIVGHSCGLSDRTLLKSIFEHEQCLSIKIFHRGKIDEHLKKNMAISRHFADKLLLRKRVLPFDKHAIIPQAK